MPGVIPQFPGTSTSLCTTSNRPLAAANKAILFLHARRRATSLGQLKAGCCARRSGCRPYDIGATEDLSIAYLDSPPAIRCITPNGSDEIIRVPGQRGEETAAERLTAIQF